jgi:hypothetical protein
MATNRDLTRLVVRIATVLLTAPLVDHRTLSSARRTPPHSDYLRVRCEAGRFWNGMTRIRQKRMRMIATGTGIEGMEVDGEAVRRSNRMAVSLVAVPGR